MWHRIEPTQRLRQDPARRRAYRPKNYFAGRGDQGRRITLHRRPSSKEACLPGSNAQSLVAGLVASHGLQLRRFLLARVRNVADVPDFIQEVYLRMLRVPNAESIRSPEAYLFTVAQHVVQQQALQSGTPAQLMRMLDPSQSGHDANPEQDASAQQCLEQLQKALDGLHPKVAGRLHSESARRPQLRPDRRASWACRGPWPRNISPKH